jgi:hypothetical protein
MFICIHVYDIYVYNQYSFFKIMYKINTHTPFRTALACDCEWDEKKYRAMKLPPHIDALSYRIPRPNAHSIRFLLLNTNSDLIYPVVQGPGWSKPGFFFWDPWGSQKFCFIRNKSARFFLGFSKKKKSQGFEAFLVSWFRVNKIFKESPVISPIYIRKKTP